MRNLLICVRVSKKGPKDAADQVEYFNGSVETPLGRCRAKNGHPEPYRIKFWQIGNERAGKDYEERLPEFCAAMKAVDPSITCCRVIPRPGCWRKRGNGSISSARTTIPSTISPVLKPTWRNVRKLIAKHAPGRAIKVGVTEWNTTAGDWGPRRAMLWTLANALACAAITT